MTEEETCVPEGCSNNNVTFENCTFHIQGSLSIFFGATEEESSEDLFTEPSRKKKRHVAQNLTLFAGGVPPPPPLPPRTHEPRFDRGVDPADDCDGVRVSRPGDTTPYPRPETPEPELPMVMETGTVDGKSELVVGGSPAQPAAASPSGDGAAE
ncbi:TPA_asm: LO1 [Tilapia adomavirus 1]|uniref:LO1 n=1 Tax=Tilapia adomavirus 1 TaxID=2597803 RepID=A0A5H3CUG8_9VIRU|nr:TPA_asm: LO1 [Tilapia adomavirus 1]